MKLTKSAQGILSARYRSVLIKCFLANLMLFPLSAKAATTISDGTHENESISDSDSLLIEGGTFTSTSFDALDITITGGTFNDALFFNASTLSIDSDNTVFNITAPSSIDAYTLNITGNSGVSVSNTVIDTSSFSGNITVNGNSLLGDFVNTEDFVFQNGEDTLHSASSKSYLSDYKHDVEFSNSTITLNGNSSIGSGYYSMSSDLFTPPQTPHSATGTAGGQDSADSFPLLRGKLTDAEIDAAVAALLDDIYGSSAELSDFSKAVFGNASKADLQSTGKEDLESELRDRYARFNDGLDWYGANVTISDSTVVLNDNARLINDSLSNKTQPKVASTFSFTSVFEAGNIDVHSSTIIVNGNNELSAKSGSVAFFDSTLAVAENAVLTFSSADGALHMDSGSTLDLRGTMIGDVAADNATITFQTSSARLNGTLSGSADVNFNADYALSDVHRAYGFSFRDIVIGNGKTLDIGSNGLTASSISGGTISAILTDAAKTTPIITADAKNVTIKLEMSTASETETTLYHITKGSGFKLGRYLTSRYAVSTTYFDPADASKIGALTDDWDGGDLYILRLSASSIGGGMTIHPVIKDALQILDLNAEDLDKLTDEQQNALNKIDDLLTEFDNDAKKKYQIMREIAPDLSKLGILIDETHAKNVINVVSTRFNMPIASFSKTRPYLRRMYGRSGGDYETGNGALWAQGLYNHAEQRGSEGFSSDSAGFAAGFEAFVSDDFKAGLGYSYASTSIDADRSDIDVDTHTGFVYAQYQPKRFYTNFFAGFGRSNYTDKTKVAKLESEYQTNTISAQIAAGYAAPVMLSPEIALRVINTHQKAYTDALGVELKSQNTSIATAVGGFKLSKRYRLKTNTAVSFTPELKAFATYDFVRSGEDRTALLPNGASYVVETDADKRVGAEIGAGFSLGFGKSGSLSVLYDGMLQGKLQSHSVVLNAKINL